jgi:hypothetical protein
MYITFGNGYITLLHGYLYLTVLGVTGVESLSSLEG